MEGLDTSLYNTQGYISERLLAWGELPGFEKQHEALRTEQLRDDEILVEFSKDIIHQDEIILTSEGGIKYSENDENGGKHQKDRVICDWLTPMDYEVLQPRSASTEYRDAAEWLLETDGFRKWLQESSLTIYSRGKLEMGKTIFGSVAFQHLRSEFSKDAPIGVAYLYCGRRQQEQQSSIHLMLGLLKQLVQGLPSTPECVENLFRQHEPQGTRPSTDEISVTLRNVASFYSRVFIVIDALDELSPEICTGFLHEISALQAEIGANLFVTSRFQPELEAKFDKSIRMEAYPPAQAMEKILTQEPSSLKYAKRVFMWIIFAKDNLKDKLTPLRIQHAASVDIGASDLDRDKVVHINTLLSLCAGLTMIDHIHDEDDEDDEFDEFAVCFVHGQVREYFDRCWMTWFPDVHFEFAKICITYLSFETFESGYCTSSDALDERLKSYALYEYAALNWGYHAKESSIDGERLLLEFFGSPGKLSACSQVLEPNTVYHRETRTTGLHLAACHGLTKSTLVLMEASPSVDPIDYKGQTPLSLAAGNGHEEVVRYLLEANADIEARDGRTGMTPLLKAAEGGYESIVRILLERGARVDATTELKMNAFTEAARNGHEAVVELLLERNAHIETKDSFGKTPLSFAAEGGFERVVKLLLEKYADIETKDSFGKTPLSFAAEGGFERVVKLLLEKGADIETEDNDGKTPLDLATENGHGKVVQLLRDRSGLF